MGKDGGLLIVSAQVAQIDNAAIYVDNLEVLTVLDTAVSKKAILFGCDAGADEVAVLVYICLCVSIINTQIHEHAVIRLKNMSVVCTDSNDGVGQMS